ncbi:MAG: HU family DNA-binding protein [Acidithiobacillus sp.]|nr:HU family DNA-binding protein [Acidithiobacillus sp.]
MTVTKAELADHLCESVGLLKRDALALVDGFFVEMRRILACGEPVLLSGFGRFTVREKRSRPGHDFRTGKTALIAARRVVTFSASQNLRNSVNKVKR